MLTKVFKELKERLKPDLQLTLENEKSLDKAEAFFESLFLSQKIENPISVLRMMKYA